MPPSFKPFSDIVEQPFDLRLLQSAANNAPIDLGKHQLDCDIRYQPRVNNMLIKHQHSEVSLPASLSPVIADWVMQHINTAHHVASDISKRYIYLTLDNAPVQQSHTQREGGWHLDGLQGAEVPNKFNNCFQFLWVSNTPTEFCTQAFNVNDLNINTHNIFKAIERQVKPENCYTINTQHTYLMHCYHAHRATPSAHSGERLFLRLYFSHCPVTSQRATLNPDITYPFIPHTTTGAVPEHLQ